MKITKYFKVLTPKISRKIEFVSHKSLIYLSVDNLKYVFIAYGLVRSFDNNMLCLLHNHSWRDCLLVVSKNAAHDFSICSSFSSLNIWK
jgi:hypothetical protein